MAESSVCQGMSANEILALKEELLNQKQRMQELYIELEAERECSSTSASESLSMILRLQGELAVEKMESSQYRRMSESRMKHAEESMAVFEELLYWKEMEIASLKCQVQAYRYKMLSMGFSDLAIGDMKFHEHLMMPYTEDHNRNFLGLRTVRRNNSVPPFRFKDIKFEMDNLEKPINFVSELLEKKVSTESDSEYDDMSQDGLKLPKAPAVGNTRAYWKKIRQLVDQVKVLSHGNGPNDHDTREDSDCVLSIHGLQSNILVSSDDLRAGPRPSLSCSDQRGNLMSDPGSKITGNELNPKDAFTCLSSLSDDLTHLLNLDNSSALSLQAKRIINTTDSLSFHDKFEVPQTLENGELCGRQEEEVLSLECEKKMCSNDQSKSSNPSDEATVACHWALANRPTDAFPPQTILWWHNEQSQQFKDEPGIVKQEAFGGAMPQFMVLKDIRRKISTMISEKRSSQAGKCPSSEFSLVSVMEAMLCYSL